MDSIDGHDFGNITDHTVLRDGDIKHPVVNPHRKKSGVKLFDKLPSIHARRKVSDEVSFSK